MPDGAEDLGFIKSPRDMTLSGDTRYVGDDVSDTTDASFLDPYGNADIILSKYDAAVNTKDFYNPGDTTPAAIANSCGSTQWEVCSSTGETVKVDINAIDWSTYDTTNIENEYRFVVNNIGKYRNADTTDSITNGVYNVDLQFAVKGAYALPFETDPTTVAGAYIGTSQASNAISIYAERVAYEIDVLISDDQGYDTSISGKSIYDLGDTDASISLFWTDVDATTSVTLRDDQIKNIVYSYCPVTYPTGSVDSDYAACNEYDGYGKYVANDHTGYNPANSVSNGFYSETENSTHGLQSSITIDEVGESLFGVYQEGEYTTIFDRWNNVYNYYSAQDIQIVMNQSKFEFIVGVQNTWKFGTDVVNQNDLNGKGLRTLGSQITSTAAPLMFIEKYQYDEGIDGDSSSSNDGIVVPGEKLLYTIAVTNAGTLDTPVGYQVTDDLALNVLEGDYVTGSLAVKKMSYTDYYDVFYNDYLTGVQTGVPPFSELCTGVTCTDVSYSVSENTVTINEPIALGQVVMVQFEIQIAEDLNGQTDFTVTNSASVCSTPSSCIDTPEVTIDIGGIKLGITKAVNDVVDSTYTPSEGIAANGDTYASSEEWLNYTLTITNTSADGAVATAQNVNVLDDLTLDTNLNKIDPATIVVTSSIDGELVAPADYTDASTQAKLDITLPTMAVDEIITITFKAQVS